MVFLFAFIFFTGKNFQLSSGELLTKDINQFHEKLFALQLQKKYFKIQRIISGNHSAECIKSLANCLSVAVVRLLKIILLCFNYQCFSSPNKLKLLKNQAPQILSVFCITNIRLRPKFKLILFKQTMVGC